MSLFEQFPTILYDVSGTGNGEALVHTLRRFKIAKLVKDTVNTYNYYTIKDGESPDLLAYKMYGKSEYHWIILLFNDILDPFTGWPIQEEKLIEYLKVKYGSTQALYYPHHFEDTSGNYLEYVSLDANLVTGSNVITNYNILTGYLKNGVQLSGVGTTGGFITGFTGSSITLDSTVSVTGRERLYSTPPGGYMVTNLEYETRLNNNKRRIKIPKQELLGKIISQVETILKNN